MSARGKLRILEGNMVAFYCKGCNQYHSININKDGTGWEFNENYESPTFTPSIKVTSGHYMTGHNGGCWCTYNKSNPDNPSSFKCLICHCYVTNGKIEYLSDCSHDLAGKIVEMENELDK